MVVDDNEEESKLVELILRDHYEIVFAHDGMDVLEKLETHQPDLFLLDVEMPAMNGFDTCVAIRRHPDFKNAQVIFHSCHDDKESIKKMYENGGNFYIAKPIDRDRLLRNLEMTISRMPALPPKQYTIEQLNEMQKRSAAEKAKPALSPIQEKDALQNIASELEATAEKPRLMLVDDDREIRDLVSISLQENFDVITCEDGCDAMARILEIEPDIIILDIEMPRMNGCEHR